MNALPKRAKFVLAGLVVRNDLFVKRLLPFGDFRDRIVVRPRPILPAKSPFGIGGACDWHTQAAEPRDDCEVRKELLDSRTFWK
jgi:hypothetical protein